jgi:hypothetical protein
MINDEYVDRDAITPRWLTEEAVRKGTTPAIEAIRHRVHGMLQSSAIWYEPASDDIEQQQYSAANLTGVATSSPLLTYCKDIAAAIQFPENTAFLHGLGVLSSAMNLRFKYSYYGAEKPPNLYVVTAQPPSTGKSGINEALVGAVRRQYAEVTKTNRVARRALLAKIAKLEKEIASEKNDNAINAKSETLDELLLQLAEIPEYIYAVDDTTPEALEDVAGKQGGLFNVISDEADAVNTLLGNVYSDKKANYGIFLKGWDGDFHSPARITRTTVSGHVYGTICVIAQDESINAILHAGMSGRGISERILIMRERNMFGERSHSTYTPIPERSKQAYEALISNIVNTPQTKLTFSGDAQVMIQTYRDAQEHKLADGGEYSNAMLRGVVGKADKQIRKISCVLHAAQEWSEGGNRSTVISSDMVMTAIMMYDQLINSYIVTADQQGFAGANAELQGVIDWISGRAKKGVLKTSIRELRDGIKSKSIYKNLSNLTESIRCDYLPELERRHYLAVDRNAVWINPRLK